MATKKKASEKVSIKKTAAKKPAAKKPAAKKTAAKKTAAKKTAASAGAESASAKIDARIAELGDFRGELLARVRALVHQAIPDVVEEWKWRGVPVWYADGIVCTGESYKDYVKLTFAKGASLDDPARLFNASMDGNARRAIDLRAGDQIDDKALEALLRAAAELNRNKRR